MKFLFLVVLYVALVAIFGLALLPDYIVSGPIVRVIVIGFVLAIPAFLCWLI